jgi:DNA invertase Pin-like site-specific DNA recombinase
MTDIFDVYTRVSDEDGRSGPSFGSPEEQEAVGRRWIEQQEDAALGEVVYDGNVSGAKPVDDRELGRLIRKVEAGESAGIILRYVDRYARDMIEGAMALVRITEAGGRLIAPDSGFDSARLNAETRMVFNIQLAIAQAQRERNIESRMQGTDRAAERGVYLASKPPLGYNRRDGELWIQPRCKKLVREAFRRRAEGQTAVQILAYLRETGRGIETVDEWTPSRNRPEGKRVVLRPFDTLTENGVRHLLGNIAYIGKGIKPGSKVKGIPPTEYEGGWRIITDTEWEQARAAGGNGHFRNTGRWAAQARLRGLVYCENGHRLKVGALGTAEGKRAAYVCTHATCDRRAGIHAERLDEFVSEMVTEAVYADEPHVTAILAGDDRYERALAAVEAARAEVEAYRDGVKVTDVGGVDGWRRGLEARQAELEAARAALRDVTPTAKPYSKPLPVTDKDWARLSMDERREVIGTAMDRDANARFVARVVVSPVGRGRRVQVGERAEIWFVGAAEAWDAPEVEQTVTDEQMAALRASVGTEGEQVA